MDNLLSIYRAYGGELESYQFRSFRPAWFDKLKCWQSFYNVFSAAGKIVVVWDGDKNNKLHDYITKFPVEIIYNENLGNNYSFLKCLNLAKERASDYKNIYFSEDDYLYLKSAALVLDNLLEISQIATLYDHRDRYTQMGESDITFCQEQILLGKYGHLRTCESTCCSFGCSSVFISECFEDLIKYSPFYEKAPRDREMWRQLIKNGFRLICPMPGEATHLVKNLESPFINWEQLNSDIVLNEN